MSHSVVLITGALTGIGRTTALAFARDRARLIVSGRHEAEGESLEAELRSLGAEATFVKADVRFENEVVVSSMPPSRRLAGWTSRSTAPVRKAHRVPSPT